MAEYGRPKSNQPTVSSIPTISALEGMAQQDQRSADQQRMMREQARLDAEYAAKRSTARGIVYAVIGMLGLMAALDLLQAVSGGNLQAVVRGGLGAFLAYQLFLGKSWARAVVVGLIGISALIVIPASFALVGIAPMMTLFLVLVFGGLLAGAIALFLEPAKHYFDPHA